MTEPTACPLCGGALKPRTNATTGHKFLGCARYPACAGKVPSAETPTGGGYLDRQMRARHARSPRRTK